MPRFLKKMQSPELLRYLPEPLRASEWEEEVEEEEGEEEENADNAVVRWSEEPVLVAPREEETQNGKILGVN